MSALSLWPLAVILASQALPAASFDCTAARTGVEKMICKSPRLSKLDDELHATYQEARKVVEDAASLRQAQVRWIQSTRDACASKDCVEGAYLLRIESIRLGGAGKKKLFAGQPPPREIFGRYTKESENCVIVPGKDDYECSGMVESFLDLAPASGNAVAIDTTLFFFNGHDCTFKGTGEWAGDELRFPSIEDSSEGNCVLIVRVHDGKAVTEDPNEACKFVFCGMRGSFHGYELTKAKNAGVRPRGR